MYKKSCVFINPFSPNPGSTVIDCNARKEAFLFPWSGTGCHNDYLLECPSHQVVVTNRGWELHSLVSWEHLVRTIAAQKPQPHVYVHTYMCLADVKAHTPWQRHSKFIRRRSKSSTSSVAKCAGLRGLHKPLPPSNCCRCYSQRIPPPP